MPGDIRVIDEFPFTFYGDTFTVALASDRKLYAPLPLICKALDIDVNGQIQRIKRDEAVADALATITLENYPYGDDQTRSRTVSCLRLDRLPYWLGTIDAGRVKDKALRRSVIRFKREFADVAWAAFRSEILPPDVIAELDTQLPPEQQAYLAAMDEAAELRLGLADHSRKIDDLEERLTGLEAKFEGTDFINPAQGRQYQEMVNILANLLKKKGKGGHAAVHGEVKKVFKVPSYLLIPEARYGEVVRFLSNWYARLTPPGTPIPEAFTRPQQKRLL